MEKINESSSEEKDVESSKLNFPGERVKLDWDEIRRGVLAPEDSAVKLPESSASETADSTSNPPQFSSINIPVEAFEFQKEAVEEDGEFKTKEEDVLNGEEFARPSISEIIDSKQIVDSEEINEAKKELEEMFSRFSGDQKDIKEKIEEQKEMFDRPSEIPSPLVKEDGPLEDQEELLNSQPGSFPVPLPPKETIPSTEIVALENQIDKKNQETKIVSDLSEKFGIPIKTETSLSTEIIDLKSEKEALENPLQTEKEKSWTEKQKEKVLSFIKGKKLETEQKAESLSPEKKTLLKKITDIAKNRKVQVAVVGAILLGISVTVPPVGGAAWLTHGLVSGFLPAEYGLGLIYTGIASGAGLIGASGAGSEILRKIIEKRTGKKDETQEVKKESSTEDTTSDKTKTKRLVNFARGAVESAKGMVKPLPPKPEAKDPKEALIEKVTNFTDLFKALKDLNEKNIDADEIKKDIDLIKEQVNEEKEKPKKEYLIDLTTGHNSEDDVAVKYKENLGINIPKDYGIDKKVNFLLKAEVENPLKEVETETQEITPTEEETDVIEEKTFNTFDELYSEIRKNEKEAESIIANIEQIKENIPKKDAIYEYLVKVPKNILPKLQEVINKEGVTKPTEGIKKEAPETSRDFSSVENFDDLLFRTDLGLTEDEKTDIRFIRIGHKEIGSLEKNLRSTVLRLLAKDAKIIAETHDTTSFYDALKKICDSADTQNSFSYTKIIDSMRHYINPDPKNDREKVLQEIPEIYGIRKKFLDICNEEINKNKTLEESSIPKKVIENNPEVLVTGETPKETTNKGPIASRIQEVVAEKEISETTSLLSLFNTLRKMTGDVFDYNETKEIIDSMDSYGPNLSTEEKAKILEKIPEIYGIRKKFLDLELNDSFPKNTEINSEVPQKTSGNESIATKIQEVKKEKEESSLKKEQGTDAKEEKEKKVIEENEKILEETDNLDEFRDAVYALGFDGDEYLLILKEMIEMPEGDNRDTRFSELPEDHGIRDAAIRIWENK